MRRKYILPLLLPVQIVLLQVLSFFPESVERWYSTGLYIGISRFLRLVFGWIPFSAGDLIYFAVIVWLIVKICVNRKTLRSRWKSHLLSAVSYFSVFYFVFNLLWGINYHRMKLPDKMGFATEYSDADLLAFTKRLIARTNALHLQIVKRDDAKVVFPYSQQQVFEKNYIAYSKLAAVYPSFDYDYPSNKKSLISLPLTYMGFAGYLNPFTNESQVNYLLPMYGFPTVASHEMAHQLGYASESEANFIGYLATATSDDPYFKYSAYTTALKYCLSNWEIRNEKVLDELLATINPGIRANFQESRDFWNSYESFIETGFHLFYDHFLKLNQQEEGLDSYNRFVDMLVNYYKNRPL